MNKDSKNSVTAPWLLKLVALIIALGLFSGTGMIAHVMVAHAETPLSNNLMKSATQTIGGTLETIVAGATGQGGTTPAPKQPTPTTVPKQGKTPTPAPKDPVTPSPTSARSSTPTSVPQHTPTVAPNQTQPTTTTSSTGATGTTTGTGAATNATTGTTTTGGGVATATVTATVDTNATTSVTPTATVAATTTASSAIDAKQTSASPPAGMVILIAISIVVLLVAAGLSVVAVRQKRGYGPRIFPSRATKTARPITATPWLNQPGSSWEPASASRTQEANSSWDQSAGWGNQNASTPWNNQGVTETPQELAQAPTLAVGAAPYMSAADVSDVPFVTGSEPVTPPDALPDHLQTLSPSSDAPATPPPTSVEDGPGLLSSYTHTHVFSEDMLDQHLREVLAEEPQQESAASQGGQALQDTPEDPILETIMRQAQMGLFVSPNREVGSGASRDEH